MDPVTLILTALASNITPGAEGEPSPTQEARDALESLVAQRLSGRPHGELVLAQYQTAPNVWEAPLAAELTAAGADGDAELLTAAQTLLRIVEKAATRSTYDVKVEGSQGIQFGDGNVQLNVFHQGNPDDSDLARAKETSQQWLQRLVEFEGSVLEQALRNAATTFRFSMAFMTAGGIIVLIAGTLALTHTHGGSAQPIALVSGLAGLIVGTSGAAFSLKADKYRKNLDQQANRMHAQLLDDRDLTEAKEQVSKIKDDKLTDRARATIVLRLMGAESEPKWLALPPEEHSE